MGLKFIFDRHGVMKPKLNFITLVFIASIIISSCQSNLVSVDANPVVDMGQIPLGLTAAEARTLASLEQIDDYPLYTMVYEADYIGREKSIDDGSYKSAKPAWACSLFAVFGDPEDMLFGRNFDWDYSPGLLLFTDPPGGYASVSMVDLYYLGFGGIRASGITDLPLEDRIELLDAPLIPFDGMNEAGLAIGMAAVPDGGFRLDPGKDTVDSVMIIRKILDQAATIEEAVAIVGDYNIDMLGQYLHYLVADKTGRSALIEFSGGELNIIPNSGDWQSATNFLLSETIGNPEDQCWRYGLISRELSMKGGILSPDEAMGLLEEVTQESTQWSVIYRSNAGELRIAMGGNFNTMYELDLESFINQ